MATYESHIGNYSGGTNAPEAFGIFPGDPEYDTFGVMFPKSDDPIADYDKADFEMGERHPSITSTFAAKKVIAGTARSTGLKVEVNMVERGDAGADFHFPDNYFDDNHPLIKSMHQSTEPSKFNRDLQEAYEAWLDGEISDEDLRKIEEIFGVTKS